MRIRTKYKGYNSIAEETNIDSLVLFFDKNGSEDDRFLANFYQGQYLFDNYEWARAYESFCKTYKQRPTKVTEHSKEILRGLFSDCVILCIRDRDTLKTKEWLDLAEKSGAFSERSYDLDALKASLAVYKHQDDSCIYYLNKSFEDIKKEKVWNEDLSFCVNEQAKVLAMMGRTADFNKRYEYLKEHPYKGTDATTELAAGLFFAQNGVRDSSRYHYRKAMQSEITDVALNACVQLAIDARNHGENDSVFKYFQDCVTLYDRLIEERQNSYSRRMETMYRNEELKAEIAEHKIFRLTLLLCIVVAMLTAIVGWHLVISLRRRLKTSTEKIEKMRAEQILLENKLQRSLEDIEKLEKQRTETLNNENQRRLESLCLNLKQYAAQKSSAPHQLCDEFLRLFAEQHYDAIRAWRQAYADIKPTDILICALVFCDFGMTEVASIINHDRQEVRQFMMRISRGISGSTVSRIADFKALISL